jgi:hypothetical protein
MQGIRGGSASGDLNRASGGLLPDALAMEVGSVAQAPVSVGEMIWTNWNPVAMKAQIQMVTKTMMHSMEHLG